MDKKDNCLRHEIFQPELQKKIEDVLKEKRHLRYRAKDLDRDIHRCRTHMENLEERQRREGDIDLWFKWPISKALDGLKKDIDRRQDLILSLVGLKFGKII